MNLAVAYFLLSWCNSRAPGKINIGLTTGIVVDRKAAARRLALLSLQRLLRGENMAHLYGRHQSIDCGYQMANSDEMERTQPCHQTQPGGIGMTSAISESAALHLALLSLAGIIAVLSFLKSFTYYLNPFGEPYFFFNYSDGLIKRGLVGQIFITIYPGASPGATRAAALSCFTVASLGIVTLLGVWLLSVAREWLALFGLFAASQFLPTLGYETGYLDAYLYVLVIVASMALAGDRLLIVAVIGFVGPFVHEGFVFLWLPLLVLAVWRGGLRPVHAATLCLPILSSLIVYFCYSPAAAVAQVNAAPLSDWMKRILIGWQVNVTVTAEAQRMYSIISAHSVNYIIALVFYTLPAALIALCYASQRKDGVALLLATYAPALSTLIAWDLSRFLVATSLSAMIGVLFMQSTRPAVPTKSLLWCWPITALLFALPLIWAFYDRAFIPKSGPIDLNDTPWANVIRSDVIPWYNRDYVP
jgi:hypothetical protein